MKDLIIALASHVEWIGIILGLVGVSVTVWSFIDTRKKAYEEFLRRKGKKND